MAGAPPGILVSTELGGDLPPEPARVGTPLYGDRMRQVHRTLDPDGVLTVLVTDRWDGRGLLEIEAIAAMVAA